jgi:hypothetical protein
MQVTGDGEQVPAGIQGASLFTGATDHLASDSSVGGAYIVGTPLPNPALAPKVAHSSP